MNNESFHYIKVQKKILLKTLYPFQKKFLIEKYFLAPIVRTVALFSSKIFCSQKFFRQTTFYKLNLSNVAEEMLSLKHMNGIAI